MLTVLVLPLSSFKNAHSKINIHGQDLYYIGYFTEGSVEYDCYADSLTPNSSLTGVYIYPSETPVYSFSGYWYADAKNGGRQSVNVTVTPTSGGTSFSYNGVVFQ
jgi:hypothetical protein